jgi:2-C-methyl-D-erythritol 4-phosphate cytidylyltransferase / 2-C-methyl-D-erythritol 2,4-cyclodiphosphate synthase
MTVAAVIVAAGRGLRAGGGLPKQWRTVAGRAVAAWTLDAFRTSPLVGPIALVLHPDDMGLAPGYAGHPDVTVTTGGATRDASVRAGLEALVPFAPDHVLIHDVARPLVSHGLIARVVEALAAAEAAAPALAVSDALWRGAEGRVTGTVDRTGLWRAQTPQGFGFDRILEAHRRHGGGAADDVEVARAAGLDVVIVPGEESNLKITGPEDFLRAERLLRDDMDIRTGNGFDVHAFAPGDRVILCGVEVPHTHGLLGHSDADVGMHALTDAIYGALADGDIGRHFPPSDPQWKGADSAIFLDHAVRLAAERGYRIANGDVTLICERPKIGPHATAMQERLEEIMGLGPGRISVKATTSERLGFTGREEGIAAIATVTLVPR